MVGIKGRSGRKGPHRPGCTCPFCHLTKEHIDRISRKQKERWVEGKYAHINWSEIRKKQWREGKMAHRKTNRMFGDENPAKRSEVRMKMSEAQRGRSWVDRVGEEIAQRWKKEHSKRWKENNPNTWTDRTGKNNPMHNLTPQEKEKWREKLRGPRPQIRGEKNPMSNLEYVKKARRNASIKPTSIERKLIKVIKTHNLPFRYTGDGQFWVKNMNPDFVHNNGQKLVVEAFGDYWHGGEISNNTREEEENRRKEKFAKYGFKTLIIWEHELSEFSDKEIAEKIRNFVGSN